MQQKKRALGKGLGALLPVRTEPVSITAEAERPDKIDRLPVRRLVPNPRQPRRAFDETSLAELAESLRRQGLIQPVVVTPRDENYLIVAGERRWRAAQLAGLTEIPVVVLDLADQEVLEYALVENLQREDLNALEEARGYQELIDQFSLSQEEVAERVGKSRPAVANALRLLKLPEDIQHDVEVHNLTAGHARALLSVDNPDTQRRLRDEIVRKQLSVRAAEELAGMLNSPRQTKPRKSRSTDASSDTHTKDLREQMIEALACRVEIKTVDEQRGKIEIFYNSLDELERVLSLMGIQN